MKSFESESNLPADCLACAQELLETAPVLVRTVRARMRSMGARDLTLVEFRTMALVTSRHGATLSDVTDHIGLSMPSMSKIVNSLVKQRLLQRKTSPEDRRCMALLPTAKGIKLHAAARAHTQRYLAARLAELDASQRQQVTVSLGVLRRLFGGVEASK